MAKPLHEPGVMVDGFRLEQLVHRGGMAMLWRVTRPDLPVPVLMKVPRIGEGADPDWVLTTVMEMVAQGALAVLGNHDNAINVPGETMNSEAQVAIEWSRGQLGPEQRRFLADLPLTLQDESRLYVHAEASKPKNWIYVKSTVEAAHSLEATPAHITFCGHIHTPALYSLSITAKMTAFTPVSGVAVPMLPEGRALARPT